ncbi:hypothetical protein MIND_01248600 [Mycena indigotica]|uniref:DUF6534 domain-containing protein n=1 Tax=Mycena indigotica TaxID=2126181 RepID=A0A8H6S5J0_9AGAR|nr:uncharacterized protein MIND_01248600 [Mycena indigotica]KAF7292212.1 hypothetical protein MIND_01248600 [Mycena indigotica]
MSAASMASMPYTMAAATLDNTLGAVFLGVVISCILYGISVLQVYLYYHFYPSDSLLHKCSVTFLFFLDSLHLALTVSAAYHYAVTGFGHEAGLQEVVWQIKLGVAVNVVVILLVQSLYAYRVVLLSGYHQGVLGYLVCAVVISGFAVGIVLAYETYTVNTWADTADIAWAIYACFSASTTIDVVLSGAMCYYLKKSQGAERVLNSRISTLMQYTLSCGVFTSACSVACLFSFILMSNNLIFISLTFILTRLYANSFMAMLNARARRRPTQAPAPSGPHPSTPYHLHSPSPSVVLDGTYVQRRVSITREADSFDGESKTDVEHSPLSTHSKHTWDMLAPPITAPRRPARPPAGQTLSMGPTQGRPDTYNRGW